MSQDSFSFETRAWSSSEGGNSHVKLSYKKRRVEVRFRGEVIEIAYFAPSGRRGGGGAQKDAAGRDVPLRRIELKPWSILSLKNIFLDFESDTEFEALEKAFQIRHADATGEVEERWFAKFMPQELIDRFALYDEEHLGGANAKTFNTPHITGLRDADAVAKAVQASLQNDPHKTKAERRSAEKTRSNEARLREAAVARDMDEVEVGSGRRLQMVVAMFIICIAIMCLFVGIPMYGMTELAWFNGKILDALLGAFAGLGCGCLVCIPIFRDFTPACCQRAYVADGRLMYCFNVQKAKLYCTDATLDPLSIMRISGYKKKRFCIVLRGSFRSVGLEGGGPVKVSRRATGKVRIMRTFTDEAEQRLLDTLDEMVSQGIFDADSSDADLPW